MKTAKEAAQVALTAQQRRKETVELAIELQYDGVMVEVAKLAEAGERNLEYRRDLKPETVTLLKKNGFKVSDLGENVASIYEITW